MRRYLPLGLLALVLVYFTGTGFQCGSAESTSAKLYMQQKNWARAEESLLKEVAKKPTDEEAYYMLGQVRYELKNYSGMNDAFTKALSISDQHKTDIVRYRLSLWGSLYNEGVGLYNKGRDTAGYYDQALEKFNLAISLVPDSANTYYVAALAYYAKKDPGSAMKYLQTAIQKDPNYMEAIRLLGQLHYSGAMEKLAAKDTAGSNAALAKTTELYEKAYALDPSNSDNIRNLIDVYERSGETAKAMKLTSDAVAKDPENKVYRFAYGMFLLRQEKFPESIEQFQEALKIDPVYTDATYNLGVAYLNWGVSMKQEADRKYEEARKANKGKDVPEDLSYKEKFRAALPYLEKATETRADEPALWQTLGKLYANLSMTDKAAAAYAKFDQLTKGQ